MIYFSDVHMQYRNGPVALRNINLRIDKGGMAFISGRSGAGKSSLLRLVALIERPSSGQIIVNGQNIKHIKNRRIPYYRRRIGFVFQDHRLLADRNVFDNVALPLMIAGYQPAETRRRVNAVLDKVGLLSKKNINPATLSGGEQQRVGIARAVVHKPMILLADEPTGNLDPALSLDTMKLFEQFNQVGVTVLIASHDMDMIKKMRKRIIVLSKGQIFGSKDQGKHPANDPEHDNAKQKA